MNSHKDMSGGRPVRHGRLQGYTLVEIMLVLAIISVLVGAGIYYLAGTLDVAKEQRVRADLETITTQLHTYEMLNYAVPTTEQGLMALVQPPTTGPEPKRWKQLMTKVPLDPWGTPYQYRNPGVKSTNGFDLYSLGAGRAEGAGNIGNWDMQ